MTTTPSLGHRLFHSLGVEPNTPRVNTKALDRSKKRPLLVKSSGESVFFSSGGPSCHDEVVALFGPLLWWQVQQDGGAKPGREWYLQLSGLSMKDALKKMKGWGGSGEDLIEKTWV